jgi:hypothetical protein
MSTSDARVRPPPGLRRRAPPRVQTPSDGHAAVRRRTGECHRWAIPSGHGGTTTQGSSPHSRGSLRWTLRGPLHPVRERGDTSDWDRSADQHPIRGRIDLSQPRGSGRVPRGGSFGQSRWPGQTHACDQRSPRELSAGPVEVGPAQLRDRFAGVSTAFGRTARLGGPESHRVPARCPPRPDGE